MRIRKLTKAEHGVTRILWEEVITEDEDAFLDYYYEVKATENTIYVIEDDAGDPGSRLLFLCRRRRRFTIRMDSVSFIVNDR